jgi:hypothetical protein
MKALLIILLVLGARLATAADSPAIIRVSPDALHHIQLNFGVLSDSGKRHVSLQLATGTGAKDPARGIDYSLKYESLILGSWEKGAPPPEGMVAVKINRMELWVEPDLLKTISRSTIELVRLFSSDGKVDENALILQPAAEITVERYETKNVEQSGAGQPATQSRQAKD